MDKLLEDPVGFGGQLGFRPGLFEVLARQPEVEVLLAEFSLQEGMEGIYPTWGGERRAVNGAEGREEEDQQQTLSPGSLDLGICRFPSPLGKFHPLRHC